MLITTKHNLLAKTACSLAFPLAMLLALAGCSTDIPNSGTSILPDSDAIVVHVDTFGMSSVLREAGVMYSSPDSLLLGEADNRYGTIHADILAQLTCPENFSYPENAEVDSVCVFLVYRTWFGSGTSPMAINIYEMDKGTFNYNTQYETTLNLDDYWSGEDSTRLLNADRIIVAASPTDSTYNSSEKVYVPYIRCRTTDEFARRFFESNDFSSQAAFENKFKGLYITSTFGSSTVLHVSDITLAVYYHFTYQKAGRDTTVNDVKGFYSNAEVRKVNRVQYMNSTYESLLTNTDTNFIVSPANLYTRLSIPMKKMSDNIYEQLGSKRPYVNLAKLDVSVLNVYTGQTSQKTRDDWAQPAGYMMLIKESAADRFFAQRETPTDTCAIISALQTGTDSDGNTTYYYSYDLATLLTMQLRNQQDADTLQMLLVPVSVTTTSTSSTTTVYSSAKLLNTITATATASATNSQNPMRLEVVCSGF